MTSPSWYDLLDVEPDASDDQIRAAWKASIADLDPTDRRFRMRNQAAEVLLDPQSRAAHDADLVESAGPPATAPRPTTDSTRRVAQTSAAPTTTTATTTRSTTGSTSRATTGPQGPSVIESASRRAPGPRTLAALALVAVLLAAATAVALVRGGNAPDGELDTTAVAAARSAAEAAIVPVLSYDYRQLDQDQATAAGYLTDSYNDEYDRVWERLDDVAPKDQTVVQVEVVDSAIVRTGDDRVDVLLFIDRPTTQGDQPTPVVSKDQVTARMVLSDGTWLIDGLSTGT